MEQVHEIAIAQLRESPFNPRRTFLAIDELAADIKAIGYVHSPLRVRPILPNPLRDDIVDGYEIVFGHRRFRAAQLAGLTTLPCIVDRMSDADARRLQISENLQRKDVHPIEEAEGFQALIDDGISADQIAADNGKSRSYVYGRLKLLQAVPQVRDACVAGEIGSEVALLVARLRTPKLQEKALAYIAKDWRANLKDGGKASFRAVRNLLNEKFALELDKAIFDTADSMLLADAGACTTCPKRSGNAPEFADIVSLDQGDMASGRRPDYIAHEGPDVCTDPDCFDAKKKQHLRNEAAKLEQSGKTVVDGNKARAAISAHGEIKGAYVPLKEVRAAIKKAKASVDVVHIQDPRTGKVHEAARAADLEAAGLREKAEPTSRGSSSRGGSRDYEAERREKEELHDKLKQRNLALLDRVRAARPAQLGVFELKRLAHFVLDVVDDSEDGNILRGLWPEMANRTLDDFVSGLQIDELTRLILDGLLVRDILPNWWDADPKDWPVDLALAAEEYMVPLEEPQTPDPAAQAPKKAAARGGKKAKKAPAAEAAEDQIDDAGGAGELEEAEA